jgi:long-subunit acyl-CoA synthetase (AMP-forming)
MKNPYVPYPVKIADITVENASKDIRTFKLVFEKEEDAKAARQSQIALLNDEMRSLKSGYEARQKELAHHERVKRFTLLSERFSQLGGEITPSLKNIRSAIAEKYAHLIEAMYSGHASDDHHDAPKH